MAIDDRPILEPMKESDLGGTGGDEVEVMVPVSEIPGWWRKAKAWYENWRKSH